ncbi:MAG: PilZ domain-containing protein [Acidobacteriales bacterium]|nr:PilZ domain-containing protein [Terriglobales bacterium]
MGSERRKFERLSMPGISGVKARRQGGDECQITMLGRGGFQISTGETYEMGQTENFAILDESEGIHRDVRATVRNIASGGLVGFEFDDLGVDAAVEIGVIIGKYYKAAHDHD